MDNITQWVIWWSLYKKITKGIFLVIIGIIWLLSWIESISAKWDPEANKQEYLTLHNIYKAQETIKWKWKKVVIAVIEKWFDITHKDLIWNLRINPKFSWKKEKWEIVTRKNWANFWNITTNEHISHGTSVLWILGAGINNSIGIRGIAKNINFIPLTIADSYGEIRTKSAIIYAVDAWANIISISMSEINTKKSTLSAIEYATKKWVIVVVSAWNDGIDTSSNNVGPICSEKTKEQIIGVGAIDKKGKKTSWSNYWSCVDISALGESIYTTSSNNTYNFVDGTSFSAPIVAWIIWLGFNKYWKKSIKKVYNSLQKSTVDWIIDAEKYIEYLGRK